MCGGARGWRRGYDRVILRLMKTAISVPDATFARVEAAAARLGVSRSEFFSRAAEHWMSSLEDEETTVAIDTVLGAEEQDTAFVERAAVAAAEHDAW
jgi:metal-responsive CopG/Arc/MetJ family transcriptional regulator